jgi:hypothetical protein
VTWTLRECSAWLRLAAASVALFASVGVTQVVPALHFALVVHRLCVEHGELVHEAREAHPAPPAVPSVLAVDGADHEHEHCGVLAAPSSFAALVPRAAEGQTPAPPGLLAALVPARAAHETIALLAYAPKLAPPAALRG